MINYVSRLGILLLLISSPGLVITICHAQERMLPVAGVVVDVQGAALHTAEVVFKGKSGTIVTQTDANGSVHVNLPAGNYVVTASLFEFITAKLVDFSVPGPTAHDFRIALQIDPKTAGLRRDRYVPPEVYMAPWDLRNVANQESAQSASPATQPDHLRQSMPVVEAWREIPIGSPVYALDDVAQAKDWLERALIQSIRYQTGIWNISVEPGYSVFRIYPYLSKQDPQPSAYQGIVLKVKGTLSVEDLLTAIRNRTPSTRIDEYEVFGADSVGVRRSSRSHDPDKTSQEPEESKTESH